jgi:hypothetical protein
VTDVILSSNSVRININTLLKQLPPSLVLRKSFLMSTTGDIKDIPPTLGEAVSTPSADWASETRTALETEVTTRPTLPPTMSTPGPHVPGEFPREFEQKAQEAGLRDLQPNTTLSELVPANLDTAALVEKAKEIIPDPDDISRAAQTVVQAAAQYLPKSVADTVSGFLRESRVLIFTHRCPGRNLPRWLSANSVASEGGAEGVKAASVDDTVDMRSSGKVGEPGAPAGSVEESDIAKIALENTAPAGKVPAESTVLSGSVPGARITSSEML